MGVEPSWESGERIWAEMRPLLEELLIVPPSPRVRGRVPAEPGIYLLHDGKRPRYVGQTRNLRNRLAQHTRPSGTHHSATLAFSMAVERARERGVVVEGRTRAELQADPQVARYFEEAKATVATWTVRFIRIDDPLIRTVFEVYVHSVLTTDLNSFETH